MKGNYRKCFRGETCDVGWGNMDSNGYETCQDTPKGCVYYIEPEVIVTSIKLDPWKTGPFCHTKWIRCGVLTGHGCWEEVYCECTGLILYGWLDERVICLGCGKERTPLIVASSISIPLTPQPIELTFHKLESPKWPEYPEMVGEMDVGLSDRPCGSAYIDGFINIEPVPEVKIKLESKFIKPMERKLKESMRIYPNELEVPEFDTTSDYVFFTHIREAWSIIKNTWRRLRS